MTSDIVFLYSFTIPSSYPKLLILHYVYMYFIMSTSDCTLPKFVVVLYKVSL